MSILKEAFQKAPVLTIRDMPTAPSLPSHESKVVYTNLDERSNIEQMPIYIREGDIRYTTTSVRPSGDPTVNYFGGGGGSSACEHIQHAFENTPVNGRLFALQSVDVGSSYTTLNFASLTFFDGCLAYIGDNSGYLKISKLGITSCGGDVEGAFEFPPEVHQLTENWDP